MKVFIAVLVLIFSLQSWTKADDISDFEIEGVGVGVSLLDFMDKKDIESANVTYYPSSKKFKMIEYKKYTNNEFDKLFVTFKSSDQHYIIHEIKAVLDIDNFADCLIQRNDHVKIAKNLFPKQTKIHRYENKDDGDITGKSVTNSVDFILSTGIVRIYCDFYSEEYKKNVSNLPSHLAIMAYDNEFRKFIQTEAY